MAGRRAVEVMAGYDLERDARFDRCLKPFRPGSSTAPVQSDGGRVVYSRRGGNAPAGEPWRGVGALDFEVRVEGGDRNGRQRRRNGPNSRALWVPVNRGEG
jgi:hypothetical protein